MDVVGPLFKRELTPVKAIDMREFCDRLECNLRLMALKRVIKIPLWVA